MTLSSQDFQHMLTAVDLHISTLNLVQSDYVYERRTVDHNGRCVADVTRTCAQSDSFETMCFWSFLDHAARVHKVRYLNNK